MAERRAEAAERLAEENQVAADSFQHRLQLSEAELQQVRAELARLLSASTVRIAMAAGRVAGLIPAPLRGVLRKILRRDA